jgi:PiT family inorganic phosphate transporter
VAWAALWNFVAAFGFNTAVAAAIGKGIVHSDVVNPNMIFAALIAAILWTVWCTQKGLPISVSHALIGSLVGAGLMKAGLEAILWPKVGLIAVFIVLSPLIGFAIGWGLMVAMFWICRRKTPRRVDSTFRMLQLASAAVYSLSHGLNDAQKTMGIIMLLLLNTPALAHFATHSGDPADPHLAWWIILSCHAAIALGTYMGGWKVVATLGHKVTKLQPVGGFCAETGGGVTILVLSHFGIPVSTTHTITGAIFGVGVTQRWRAVRWGVGRTIVSAWVLTLPASAAMAALIYAIVSRVMTFAPS